MKLHKKAHHYFIPHYKNNFRAKLLHHSHLFFVIVLFISMSLYTVAFKHVTPGVLGISYSISAQDLLNITNKDRSDNHLPPLTMNSELSAAATAKAQDMFSKNYWAHFAPDGSTTPWMFIKNSGYSYVYAGENLAKGFTDSNSIVSAWMNSPTHRENMLSPNYKDIGFAVVEGQLQGEDTVLVVEMFGSQAAPAVAQGQEIQPNPTLPPAEVLTTPIPVQKLAPVIPVAQPKVIAQPAALPVQVMQASVVKQPFIDIRVTAKAITIIVLSTFVFILILDIYAIESQKIPRIVGHNLDHIMIIILFLFFIVLQSAGGII